MTERYQERHISIPPLLKAYLSYIVHTAVQLITEIPLGLRILRAPEGKLVRGDEIIAEGRAVTYSGDLKVIFTEDGRMVFPNPQAGDRIEILPHK